MGGTAEIRNAAPDRKVASKLDINPKARQAKLAAEKAAAEKAAKESAEKRASQPAKPPAKKPKSKSSKSAKEAKTPSAGQFLDLGCGYRIAHKLGSGYSTFYKVVAKHGNFEEVVKALEAGKYDLHDTIEANKLLDKMLVPIEKLEEFCREDDSWKEHATKKTKDLTSKAKDGDSKAKDILKNEARCNDGSWSGNIPEMISTCVGYYNHLMEVDAGKKGKKDKKSKPKAEAKPNKNVKKFKEAGLVFRRFPLSKGNDKSYVMMFPEKFVHDVKTAILIGRGINEDE